MKALSVKQPWAALIADGLKPVETRTWPTNYRGELLIVASAKPTFKKLLNQCPKCFEFALQAVGNFGETCCMLCGPSYKTQNINASIGGQALCIANLVDCRPMTEADEKAACCKIYPGAYAWVLNDIRKIEPFPIKGRLGLFEVEIGEK